MRTESPGKHMAEMCNDFFTCDLGTVATVDPVGPPTGTGRVLRGGAWLSNDDGGGLRLLAAARGAVDNDKFAGDYGHPLCIRVARTVIP